MWISSSVLSFHKKHYVVVRQICMSAKKITRSTVQLKKDLTLRVVGVNIEYVRQGYFFI